MSKFSSASIAVLLLAACGDDPEQQCKDLLNTICERASVCAKELTGQIVSSTFESGCPSRLEQVVLSKDCSHAVRVTSSYDACLDAIESMSCEDFLKVDNGSFKLGAMPPSCGQVIELE